MRNFFVGVWTMILRRWGYTASVRTTCFPVWACHRKTDRIPCISYVPKTSSKLTEDCFPTCDCECKRLWLRQYTRDLWKNLCDLNKISGPSNVWTLFSPFVPCIERENETVDFMERLPKYPMKSWSSRRGEDIEQAQWSVDKVFRTPRYSQLATKLQIGDRGLSEMEPQSGNNRSPLKRTPENGPNKPCSRHCAQVSLFALDEGVKNGSLFHLIGDIIHKTLQIDLEISFRKFYAC